MVNRFYRKGKYCLPVLLPLGKMELELLLNKEDNDCYFSPRIVKEVQEHIAAGL